MILFTRYRSRAYLLGFLFAGIVFFLNCALPPLSGGTSTTDNPKVIGAIIGDDGWPAPNTRVDLIPENFDPLRDSAALAVDTTDESGRFELLVPQQGVFNIQAVHLVRLTRLLIRGIVVAAGNDSVHVTGDTLKRTGSVRVDLPDSIDRANGYLYFPGTTIFMSLAGAGARVVIDSMPAATLSAVCYTTKNAPVPTVLRYDVRVLPGATSVVAMPDWKYSARFFLNTASSGAGVAGSIFDFPVLVRLNNGNFSFSHALTNGDDIRFSKENGSPLACEIERWDPVAGHAEVWVKVDTVYGNDSTQSITMYWGNSNASGTSNSAAVFDTAAGFAGVWHMGENGDSVHDATADAFHGANSGSAMAAGVIGNSRKFADGNYLKISGLLKSPSSVTLSAWVQSEKPAGGQDVISIGDAVMIRLDYLGGKGVSGWYHNSPITSDDSKYAIDSSGRYLANTGWHYLTFSISAETHVQTLYIDGEKCAVSNDVNPIYYAGLGVDTYIGIHGNGKTNYNFAGQIDEVRASNISLSPDWVKLCFMNQKSQDALVKW
jgi:hypothetical protein